MLPLEDLRHNDAGWKGINGHLVEATGSGEGVRKTVSENLFLDRIRGSPKRVESPALPPSPLQLDPSERAVRRRT
jgi:hypothetical protein